MTELKLRRAEPGDVDLYFRWANDTEVRHQSFSQDEISFPDHARWFARKLASPTSHLFVMSEDGKPVGQIRFEVNEGMAEIGYSVASEARGRGLARPLVERGLEAMAAMGITAFSAKVKADNEASCSVFLRGGFVEGKASGYRIFHRQIAPPQE